MTDKHNNRGIGKAAHKSVKISHKSTEALATVITGGIIGPDGPSAPYRSGPQLVDFFNEFGFGDQYRSGFPSRWYYTKEKLEVLNSTGHAAQVIEAAVDPRHFLGSECPIEDAVRHLNQFLEFDGWRLVHIGKWYRLRPLTDRAVEIGRLFGESNELNHIFVEEQLAKCDRKLEEGDFDGAITNARSLLEAVLIEMEGRLSNPQTYDGDLPKLYKRVYRLMNLDPGRKDISDTARQILSGLVSVISGLAPLRNKMSDAHALEYRPQKHHAALAVNASKTLVRFLVDSLEYQLKQGLVSLKVESAGTPS